MWYLPDSSNKSIAQYYHLPPTAHSINSLHWNSIQSDHQATPIAEGIQFTHAALFLSIKCMLLQVTSVYFLVMWPFFLHKNVQKHLIKTMTTHQCH